MKIIQRYFFEIPLYRVQKEDFNRQYERDKEQYLSEFQAKFEFPVSEAVLRRVEQDFWETYGGPWHFNQAIGWLRLYVLGTQIRADIWLHHARRYGRAIPHKRYRISGQRFEYSAMFRSPDEIRSDLRRELLELQKDLGNGRFYLDLECFDQLADLIDWGRLVDPGTGDAV
jgi:hypothetical protein